MNHNGNGHAQLAQRRACEQTYADVERLIHRTVWRILAITRARRAPLRQQCQEVAEVHGPVWRALAIARAGR